MADTEYFLQLYVVVILSKPQVGHVLNHGGPTGSEGHHVQVWWCASLYNAEDMMAKSWNKKGAALCKAERWWAKVNPWASTITMCTQYIGLWHHAAWTKRDKHFQRRCWSLTFFLRYSVPPRQVGIAKHNLNHIDIVCNCPGV